MTALPKFDADTTGNATGIVVTRDGDGCRAFVPASGGVGMLSGTVLTGRDHNGPYYVVSYHHSGMCEAWRSRPFATREEAEADMIARMEREAA